jgi:hypothetical protein
VAVRKWYLDRALASYPSLKAVIGELTLEEVIAALDLESSTLRRRSLIDRLISRAVRLNEVSFNRQLKEKYHHGKSN